MKSKFLFLFFCFLQFPRKWWTELTEHYLGPSSEAHGLGLIRMGNAQPKASCPRNESCVVSQGNPKFESGVSKQRITTYDNCPFIFLGFAPTANIFTIYQKSVSEPKAQDYRIRVGSNGISQWAGIDRRTSIKVSSGQETGRTSRIS